MRKFIIEARLFYSSGKICYGMRRKGLPPDGSAAGWERRRMGGVVGWGVSPDGRVAGWGRHRMGAGGGAPPDGGAGQCPAWLATDTAPVLPADICRTLRLPPQWPCPRRDPSSAVVPATRVRIRHPHYRLISTVCFDIRHTPRQRQHLVAWYTDFSSARDVYIFRLSLIFSL